MFSGTKSYDNTDLDVKITILYCFRSTKPVLNPHVNGKIQRLFKAFLCFSSTFQGKFNFQGLFKTVL